jgi:hypothetical protein
MLCQIPSNLAGIQKKGIGTLQMAFGLGLVRIVKTKPAHLSADAEIAASLTRRNFYTARPGF